MTKYGGTNNIGCVFSLELSPLNYTVILSFDTTNGSTPYGSLIISGTTLYAMTYYGGINNKGCIFSIQTNGSGYTKLLDFNSTNGANPYGSLILSGTTLYGTTTSGGSGNNGTVFSIQTNGTFYIELLDCISPNTAYTNNSLLLSNNILYTTSVYGGGYDGAGNIFSINLNISNYGIAIQYGTPSYSYNPTQGDIVISIGGNEVYHYQKISATPSSIKPESDTNNYEVLTDTGEISGSKSLVYGYIESTDRVDIEIRSGELYTTNRYMISQNGFFYNNKINTNSVRNFPFGNINIYSNDLLNDSGSSFEDFLGSMFNCVSSGDFNILNSNAILSNSFVDLGGTIDISNITDGSQFSTRVSGKFITYQNGQGTYENVASTYTITCNGSEWLFIDGGDPIVGLTINLPYNPTNGQILNINTTVNITSLVFNSENFQTSYTTLGVGNSINLIYDDYTNSWDNATSLLNFQQITTYNLVSGLNYGIISNEFYLVTDVSGVDNGLIVEIIPDIDGNQALNSNAVGIFSNCDYQNVGSYDTSSIVELTGITQSGNTYIFQPVQGSLKYYALVLFTTSPGDCVGMTVGDLGYTSPSGATFQIVETDSSSYILVEIQYGDCSGDTSFTDTTQSIGPVAILTQTFYPFTVGGTVIDTTSGATASIVSDSGDGTSPGELVLTNIYGSFNYGDTLISGSFSGTGSAIQSENVSYTFSINQGDIVIAVDNNTNLGIFHYEKITSTITSQDPSIDTTDYTILTNDASTYGLRSLVYGYIEAVDKVDIYLSTGINLLNRYSISDSNEMYTYNNKVRLTNNGGGTINPVVSNFPFGNSLVTNNDLLGDSGSSFGNFTGSLNYLISEGGGVFFIGSSNALIIGYSLMSAGSVNITNITDMSIFESGKVSGKLIIYENGQGTSGTGTSGSDFNTQTVLLPNSGAYTVNSNGSEWLFIFPAGDTTLTVNLPNSPSNGQSFNICTNGDISMLDISNGYTQNTYTSLNSGGSINLIYISYSDQWAPSSLASYNVLLLGAGNTLIDLGYETPNAVTLGDVNDYGNGTVIYINDLIQLITIGNTQSSSTIFQIDASNNLITIGDVYNRDDGSIIQINDGDDQITLNAGGSDVGNRVIQLGTDSDGGIWIGDVFGVDNYTVLEVNDEQGFIQMTINGNTFTNTGNIYTYGTPPPSNPATPVGYIEILINSVASYIPYYQ